MSDFFATQGTVNSLALLPMGFRFPRQEYWVAIFFSGASFQTSDQTHVSYIGRQVFLPLSHQGSLNSCTAKLSRELIHVSRQEKCFTCLSIPDNSFSPNNKPCLTPHKWPVFWLWQHGLDVYFSTLYKWSRTVYVL